MACSSSSEDISEREENRGGYDCEFVSPPPEAIQAECPICLSILKEPCLISCLCGQKICRECVEKIKEEDKPCPLCNKTDFSFIRDYGLERYLKAQDVYCSKKTLGCQWKGKLGDFEQHLNENPSPEEQLTGCGFVEVECKHGCGEWYERRFIDTHENEECPQRPYSCKYCKEYDSTFEDVTKIHHAECGKYPVPCPNKCQDDPFERSKINYHLNDECPLNEVSCPFAYAGCEVRLPREDITEHAGDIVTHFALLASFTRETAQNLEIAEQEISSLKKKIKLLTTLGGFPIDYEVTNMEEDVYLPPFFTHPHGYKMCIRVYPKGTGSGEGTHVSLFTYLMRGPYDDHLNWPFRGEVTIQIVNQAGDHSHVENNIEYNDQTQHNCAGRVFGMNKRSNGWGNPQFLAHTYLTYNTDEIQYLKDDIIVVQVVQVKLTR